METCEDSILRLDDKNICNVVGVGWRPHDRGISSLRVKWKSVDFLVKGKENGDSLGNKKDENIPGLLWLLAIPEKVSRIWSLEWNNM